MGNMLPCLVQGTTTLPPMSSKQRLLTNALHMMKTKKRPCNKARVTKQSPVAAEGEMNKSNSKAALRKAHGQKGHKKGVVRVKVVLTKEEAARLLALTVGGEKTVAQVVRELRRMEAGRANAVVSAWRPALESIPEEW